MPIDLGGNQTGIHKFAYQALLKHLGIAGRDRSSWTPCSSLPSRARRCWSGSTSIRATSPPGRPTSFKGGIEQNRRDGRLWHDLRDEFGVVWSMPDDQPYYMDISHHPLAEATMADIADYPFPKGDDPEPLRRAARSGRCGFAERNALRGGQRHLRRGLRNLLVHARPGALVHGPAEPAGVLRGPAGPDAEVLARLVPPVPRRGGRPGRRDHDRRRPGRPDGPAVPARRSTATIVKPRQKRLVQYIRSRTQAQDLVPHLRRRASRTFPTCWTTASTSSTRCRSARRTWTRRR